MRAALLLACTLALAACRRDEPPPPPAPTPAPAPVETRQDVLVLEGTEQPVTLEKVDVPEAPFTTFAPMDFFTITRDPDTFGSDVRFMAQDPDGKLHEDVYAAFVFPEHLNADSVYADVTSPDGMLATRGWTLGSAGATPCLWAEIGETYRDVAGDASGIVCIGTHRNRPFFLVTHVPDAWAEGFAPRLDVLLEHFRWRDTGAPLRGE